MGRMAIVYPFVSKIVGISQYQQAAAGANVGDAVVVEHEPSNPYDANACVIHVEGRTLGYLPRAVARRIVEGGASRLVGEIIAKHDAKATIGMEIRVLGSGAAEEIPSAATAQASGGLIVVAKRSRRVLGRLERIDRERRSVIVDDGNGCISYPDGLVDVVDGQ